MMRAAAGGEASLETDSEDSWDQDFESKQEWGIKSRGAQAAALSLGGDGQTPYLSCAQATYPRWYGKEKRHTVGKN